MQSLGGKFEVFFDKRVASVFLLGIAQGLPWVMIGSMLTLWLKESGFSRTKIGVAALIFTVYAINFLWSPIVEIFKPKLFFKLGHRQSWVVLCLSCIGLCCFAVSMQSPNINPSQVVLLCLIIAIFSATQDIAIDAYRVDSFASNETNKVSAAAGAATAGWWTGYAGLGALPLFLSDHDWSWPSLYILLGVITLILAALCTLLPDTIISHSAAQQDRYNQLLKKVVSASSSIKQKITIAVAILAISLVLILLGTFKITATPFGYYVVLITTAIASMVKICTQLSSLNSTTETQVTELNENRESRYEKILAWMLTALIAPIQEFFSRNGIKLAISLLCFIFLFKIGEAFLGRMSIVFYKEIGFSNSEIASYAKLMTWWLTIAFSVVGVLVNSKFGLVKGLFVSGVAMASTNLLFSLLALTGPNTSIFAIAIVLDGFSQAWSTVAFVAFISLMCNHAFSATQYALMASIGNLGRTTLSSASGYFVDTLDGNWAVFFAITTLMVIPSLIVLWYLRPHIYRLIEDSKSPP